CAANPCNTATNAWQGTSGNNSMLTLVSLVASNASAIQFTDNSQTFQGSLWTQPSSGLHFVKNGVTVEGPMSLGSFDASFNNVPLVSYLVLRGRCRGCGARIPLRYPTVELVAGLLFAACFWKFGLSGSALVGALFCLTLVAISATDLEHRIIPNRIVVPAGLIVLAANTALHPSPRWGIAAVAASGFLLAAALAYPGGMGMGDVKLAFLMGAALGSSVIVAMVLVLLAAPVPGLS